MSILVMLPLALFLSIPITYFACFIFNGVIAPFRGPSIVKKNKYVEGKRIGVVHDSEGLTSSIETYEYNFYVKGKKHIRFVKTTFESATPTMKFYYNRDPKRAHLPEKAGCIESEWKIMYVVHSIVIAVLLSSMIG